MTFSDFCRLHGVILNRDPAPGRWVRVATEDKPRHRNGAVKFMGVVGFVQNWATMQEPAVWRSDGESRAAMQRVQVIANQADKEARENARKAAQKAVQILSECELAPHPYLERKGFPDEMVNVWKRESDNVACIPMRKGSDVVGLQMIKPDGEKKFLYGQRSGGAEFIFNGRGAHYLCEGYATALSARQALANLKQPYTLHVCFSAGNMARIAESLPGGFVLADNDASGTGEKVAQQIGWPYWMSDTVGEDANDYSQRRGVFALAMGIKAMLMEARRRRA